MAGGHLAEPASQLDLGGVVEVLAPEEDHLVLDEGRADGGDLLVVEGPEVHAEHLGPEGGAEPVEGQQGGMVLRAGHDVLLWVGSSREWSRRSRLSNTMPRIEIVTMPLSTSGVCRFTPALLMR